MLIGYVRVSTDDQSLDLQCGALAQAGCEKTFAETASGARADRPVVAEAIECNRPGDTLVVWRLDRLGRSLRHLIEVVGDLQRRGICFKSVTEQFDTRSSGGKLVFYVFGALAEFERDLIRERMHAGLAAARARGKKGGRPKKLALAQRLYANGQTDIATIRQTLGVSRAMLDRALKPHPAEPAGS